MGKQKGNDPHGTMKTLTFAGKLTVWGLYKKAVSRKLVKINESWNSAR